MKDHCEVLVNDSIIYFDQRVHLFHKLIQFKIDYNCVIKKFIIVFDKKFLINIF